MIFDEKRLLEMLVYLNSMAHANEKIEPKEMYTMLVSSIDVQLRGKIPATVLPYPDLNVEFFQNLLNSKDQREAVDRIFFEKKKKRKGFFNR